MLELMESVKANTSLDNHLDTMAIAPPSKTEIAHIKQQLYNKNDLYYNAYSWPKYCVCPSLAFVIVSLTIEV